MWFAVLESGLLGTGCVEGVLGVGGCGSQGAGCWAAGHGRRSGSIYQACLFSLSIEGEVVGQTWLMREERLVDPMTRCIGDWACISIAFPQG